MVQGIDKDIVLLVDSSAALEEDADIGRGQSEVGYLAYFPACVLHPEVDHGRRNADWLMVEFHQQRTYIDSGKAGDGEEYTDAEERFPALVRLSLSSENENFADFVEIFGRWVIGWVLLRTSAWEQEVGDIFVETVVSNMTSIVSLYPLEIRAAITTINLRNSFGIILEHMRISEGATRIISQTSCVTDSSAGFLSAPCHRISC